MKKTEKKMWWIVIVVAIVLLAVAIVFLRGDEDTWIKDSAGNWAKHGNPEIRDFESCAEKYPVQETYPERCSIPNGPTFTKQY